MTKIESDTRLINKTDKQIFNFLSNFNNFEQLMPDRVENWQSDENTCSFTISGLANLGMKIVEKKPNSFIKIVDFGKVPFKFNFLINIISKGNESNVSLVFDADLNSMLKMVAVKPLRNFLNMLLDELENTEL
jgi:carbon monoxide dehydrogenase subunit G